MRQNYTFMLLIPNNSQNIFDIYNKITGDVSDLQLTHRL